MTINTVNFVISLSWETSKEQKHVDGIDYDAAYLDVDKTTGCLVVRDLSGHSANFKEFETLSIQTIDDKGNSTEYY